MLQSKWRLSLPRASYNGSGSGAAAAEPSTVGDTLEREEGGGTEAGASADESSNRKQPPPVDPKIEKELKKVPLLPLFPWFISLFFSWLNSMNLRDKSYLAICRQRNNWCI